MQRLRDRNNDSSRSTSLRIEPTYRLARERDLRAMRLIQSTALRDLIAREGKDPSSVPVTDEPSIQMKHLLRTDPKLAWVALDGTRPIAFSMGFVRGELWFLADLFVLPDFHGRGIGGELLQRCLGGGLEHGVRLRAVASSGDFSALSLYIGARMAPRFPLFGIVGAPEKLRHLPDVEHPIGRASSSSTWLRKLGDLDDQVWGRRRDGDHRFWLGEFGMTCLTISDPSGRLLGYAYYREDRVGPLAARSERMQITLLRAIGDKLAGLALTNVECRVPGINPTVLRALLEVGFRVDHLGQFMSSHPFGRFERYLPSGGTLL